jgi:hypothetical protein
MTGLKKLFNVAALLFMVCWCLALLVPEQPACEHGTHAGTSEEHSMDTQIICSRGSSRFSNH